jgi:BMFP domain-containing protein YqiC
MLNSKTLDELAARVGKAIENSPAKDIEKNVKTMLQSGLSRLDVVPRTEFDTQAQVLLRTREKLEQLEARVAEREARFSSPPASR